MREALTQEFPKYQDMKYVCFCSIQARTDENCVFIYCVFSCMACDVFSCMACDEAAPRVLFGLETPVSHHSAVRKVARLIQISSDYHTALLN